MSGWNHKLTTRRSVSILIAVFSRNATTPCILSTMLKSTMKCYENNGQNTSPDQNYQSIAEPNVTNWPST